MKTGTLSPQNHIRALTASTTESLYRICAEFARAKAGERHCFFLCPGCMKKPAPCRRRQCVRISGLVCGFEERFQKRFRRPVIHCFAQEGIGHLIAACVVNMCFALEFKQIHVAVVDVESVFQNIQFLRRNGEMNGGDCFLRRLRLLEIAKLSFNFFPGFCAEFFDDGFSVWAVTERDTPFSSIGQYVVCLRRCSHYFS